MATHEVGIGVAIEIGIRRHDHSAGLRIQGLGGDQPMDTDTDPDSDPDSDPDALLQQHHFSPYPPALRYAKIPTVPWLSALSKSPV